MGSSKETEIISSILISNHIVIILALIIDIILHFFSSPEIPLSNVSKAHLVAYDPDKDFLPMIFAHCDYSLKVGEGTTIDFNWKCLERQVVDRFIRGRPRLTPLVNTLLNISNNDWET